MAEYSDGQVRVTNGSNDVYARYVLTINPASGTVAVDEPLAFADTGASGTVLAWTPGDLELRCTVESVAQPTVGTQVTRIPTFTGTVQSIDENPQFLANVATGNIFVPLTDTPRVSYEVASIPTRSHLILNSAYAGTTASETEYTVSTAFTPNFGFPYAESGDSQPTEVFKRAVVEIDEAIQTVSGAVVVSLNTLTGVITISGADGISTSTLDSRVIVTGFYDEFTGASGTLQSQIDNLDPDDIEPALLGGVGITVTSGVSTITIDGHLRYTKAENDAIIGQGSVSVISGSNTVTVSGTDFQPFQILDPDEIDYVLDVGAFEAYTIDRAKIKCDTGTALASITIDGIPVEGLDNMSITTALTEYVATSANTVDTGDDVFLSVSGVSTSGTPILGSVRYQ